MLHWLAVKCMASRKAMLAPLIFLLVGCSSMQPLDAGLPRQELVNLVEVGDVVEIKTSAGEIRLVYVSSISDSHITSGQEQFAIEEVEFIGLRKTTSAEKAAGIAMGLSVGALLQALVVGVIAILVRAGI